MSCRGGGCGSCGPSAATTEHGDDLVDVESLFHPPPLPPTPSSPLHSPSTLHPPPPLSLHSLPSRIRSAAASLAVLEAAERAGQADEAAMAALMQAFSDIGWAMAGGNAQAMKPLLAVFDECGPRRLLELCMRLLQLQCSGHLLAWAFECVQHEPLELVRIVEWERKEEEKKSSSEDGADGGKEEAAARLRALVAAVNQQAAFYECFPGHGKVGRMSAEGAALEP